MFDLPRDRSMILNTLTPAVASPPAAESGGPQSQVHAGANTANSYDGYAAADKFIEDFWRGYPLSFVRAIYDRAVELANAEPSVPFISDTPWREPDHDYRKRLADKHPHNDHSTLDSYGLDAVGKGYGLLRSRLVKTLERARG